MLVPWPAATKNLPFHVTEFPAVVKILPTGVQFIASVEYAKVLVPAPVATHMLLVVPPATLLPLPTATQFPEVENVVVPRPYQFKVSAETARVLPP